MDTDEDGDFGDEKLMTNFHAERQWSTSGKQAMMNFALNIYDDGDTLSIILDVGAHSTTWPESAITQRAGTRRPGSRRADRVGENR